MRTYWILLLALLLPLAAVAQGPAPLAKVKIARGLKVYLPQNMRLMTQEEINSKYLSNRDPIAMYTTPDTQVDFMIKEANSRFMGDDLALAGQFYRANFQTMYDSINFLRQSLEDINGRQYLVFEFVSEVFPEDDEMAVLVGTAETTSKRVYTYVQYTVVDGRLLVFTFNCPARYQGTWQATAWDIMHSLKVR